MHKPRIFLRLALILSLLLFTTMILAHDDDPPDPDSAVDEHHSDSDVHVEDYAFDTQLTYYEHVQPILQSNCVGCHVEGQISGDIPLDDPDYVNEIAEDIARVVETRYMPPWMPDQQHVTPLKQPRILADEDIALLVQWVEAGAEMGDPANAVNAENTFALPEIRADDRLTLREPYLPSGQNTDDYRCFAYAVNIDEPMYLTGYVFEPDQTEMVHHGLLYLVPGSSQAQIDRRNGADGQDGWSCYNTTGISGEQILGTWTPGTFPVQYPENTGFLVQPDDVLVMQIHYYTGIVREPDNTHIDLQFDPVTDEVQPLVTFDLTAPVEIPCPEGVDNPLCDRNASIRDTAERYGDEFLRRPNGLLQFCGKTLADYKGIDPTHAESSCEIRVPFDITAIGVFGHMHELGKTFHMELNPGEEDARMLLDIPRWDFHWQDTYHFEEPITFKRGDTIRMTCVWDATLSDDPRYVVWGEGTEDEMCFGTLTLLDPA